MHEILLSFGFIEIHTGGEVRVLQATTLEPPEAGGVPLHHSNLVMGRDVSEGGSGRGCRWCWCGLGRGGGGGRGRDDGTGGEEREVLDQFGSMVKTGKNAEHDMAF